MRSISANGVFEAPHGLQICDLNCEWAEQSHSIAENALTMNWNDLGERWRAWLVDYTHARARAIEWLGDRYLLATPINRREAGIGPVLARAYELGQEGPQIGMTAKGR